MIPAIEDSKAYVQTTDQRGYEEQVGFMGILRPHTPVLMAGVVCDKAALSCGTHTSIGPSPYP